MKNNEEIIIMLDLILQTIPLLMFFLIVEFSPLLLKYFILIKVKKLFNKYVIKSNNTYILNTKLQRLDEEYALKQIFLFKGLILLYENRLKEYLIYYEQLYMDKKIKSKYNKLATDGYKIVKFILEDEKEYKYYPKLKVEKKETVNGMLVEEIDNIKNEKMVNVEKIKEKVLNSENNIPIPLIMLSYLILKAVGKEMNLNEKNQKIVETYVKDDIYMKLYDRLKKYDIKT